MRHASNIKTGQHALFATALFLMAGPSPAQERDNSYLGGMAGYVAADSARVPDGDRGNSIGAFYGRIFDNHLGFEVHASGDVFEAGRNQGTDFYRYMLGADLVYNFGDRRSWTPYGLIGLGASYNDVFPNEADGTDIFGNVAGGIVSPPLFEAGQIRARGEVRYIYDNFESGFDDVRISLGIEVPLFRPARMAFDAPEQAIQIVQVPSGLQDSDGDGVIDERDLCPGTPPGVRVDLDGCALDAVIDLRGVTFELDSSRLRPDAETILGYAVELMTRYPDMEVEVAGHTDDLGSDAYNEALSQRRAESVVAYITAQGVAAERLTARGYGEREPTVPNTSEANRERNRRVEMRILN